ncbi:hypothetical protein B0H14DRAFT_2600577 [Mycena olivaceomarginata]|nr:hypothetical protein B0H14DRAFT_2600577 [Mycena olivaceomarginata]
MASPLDSTMGVWLVSLFLGTILYGMGLIQTYLYFHWYTKDHWGVKAVVICLLSVAYLPSYFLELQNDNHGLESAKHCKSLFFSARLTGFLLITLATSMHLLLLLGERHISVFRSTSGNPLSTQARIGILPIAFTLTALALLQIAQTVVSTDLGSFTLLYQTKGVATLQAASALVCDVSITACFCYTLNSKKSTIKSTNSLLNMLMINAVNRGMLTAFTAALHIILFLSFPNSFWFSLALVPSGKLYMNSMLATLNTREHIRQSIQENSVGRISVSLGNRSSNPSSGPTIPQIPADTTIDMSSLNGHNSHVRSTEFIFSNA